MPVPVEILRAFPDRRCVRVRAEDLQVGDVLYVQYGGVHGFAITSVSRLGNCLSLGAKIRFEAEGSKEGTDAGDSIRLTQKLSPDVAVAVLRKRCSASAGEDGNPAAAESEEQESGREFLRTASTGIRTHRAGEKDEDDPEGEKEGVRWYRGPPEQEEEAPIQTTRILAGPRAWIRYAPVERQQTPGADDKEVSEYLRAMFEPVISKRGIPPTQNQVDPVDFDGILRSGDSIGNARAKAEAMRSHVTEVMHCAAVGAMSVMLVLSMLLLICAIGSCRNYLSKAEEDQVPSFLMAFVSSILFIAMLFVAMELWAQFRAAHKKDGKILRKYRAIVAELDDRMKRDRIRMRRSPGTRV